MAAREPQAIPLPSESLNKYSQSFVSAHGLNGVIGGQLSSH